MHKVLFLPGAGASPDFWKPVGGRRRHGRTWRRRLACGLSQVFPECRRLDHRDTASPPLPIEKIEAKTLLIWGDSDPISPVTVGRYLAQRLPNAELEIVPGGDHDVASTHADHVARLIARHLA